MFVSGERGAGERRKQARRVEETFLKPYFHAAVRFFHATPRALAGPQKSLQESI